MKSNKKTLGDIGEKIATEHLIENGYKIIHKNWRFLKDEVDIIATLYGYLVFVEVKTRKSNEFGEPYEFVSKKKQRYLIRAAQNYADNNDITADTEIRFDIVSIILNPTETKIELIENAFTPLLK